MSEKPDIKGLIAAVYTPFDSRGKLALRVLKDYARYLMESGVKGVFINGSTGDFTSLTFAERMEIVEAWSAIPTPGLLKMVHVGSNSIVEASELAAHAKKCGVDCISAIGPFYFKPSTSNELVTYCAEISRHAAGLPFYYYHIPQLTGLEFSMLEFLELGSEKIPDLAGIKYSVPDFVDLQKCLEYDAGRYKILFGSDENMLPAAKLGADGFVGSTYNHLPMLYYELLEAVSRDEIDKAAGLQAKSIEFIDTLFGYGFHDAGKEVMRHLGIELGHPRLPHRLMLDKERSELIEKLISSGFLGYRSEL